MLRNLSMILNMHENTHMLDDIISYHAPSGIQLFIMHDSEKPYEMPSKFEKFTNVYYRHMPNASYADRVAAALRDINTEYCVFRSDRRHQCNRILKKCVDFLKRNTEYSSASGIWLRNDLTPDYGTELISKDGLHDDVFTRVTNQALVYQPPYYNVSRTNLIRVFSAVYPYLNERVSNIYYAEYINAFLLFFTGKTMQFEKFAGICQNKLSPSAYVDEYFKVIHCFSDPEIAKYIEVVLRKSLTTFGFSVDGLHEALESFLHSMLIYYVVHRVNIFTKKNKSLSTFWYMENLFNMLNNVVEKDSKTIESYLRIFMMENFCRKVSFDDVKPNFSDADFAEIKAILVVIEKINKKYNSLQETVK